MLKCFLESHMPFKEIKRIKQKIYKYNLPYGCTYLAIPMFFIHSYGFELPSAAISL